MDFAFTRKNYLILIIGIVFIGLGLILMIGGGSEDPNQFSYEIFKVASIPEMRDRKSYLPKI